MFEEFSTNEPFFTELLSSDSLLIYYVEKLNGLCEVFSLDDLSYKCVIIPYKNGYVVTGNYIFSLQHLTIIGMLYFLYVSSFISHFHVKLNNVLNYK